jgi:hypothetical protein
MSFTFPILLKPAVFGLPYFREGRVLFLERSWGLSRSSTVCFPGGFAEFSPAPSRCTHMAETARPRRCRREQRTSSTSLHQKAPRTDQNTSDDKQGWGEAAMACSRYLHNRQEQETLRGTYRTLHCAGMLDLCLASVSAYLRPYLHVAAGPMSQRLSPKANSHEQSPNGGLRGVDSGSTDFPRCLCYEPGGQYL